MSAVHPAVHPSPLMPGDGPLPRVDSPEYTKGTNNIHRDETYHPQTREDFDLPAKEKANTIVYHETAEETCGTLRKMVLRQFLGSKLYLIRNRKGNPK
ncbi:uncharacterized protein B0H18DRAFT_1214371 [Fomitopsis serialis]|uniref:uncharacterized protein n=1 Tax=Fomitopsis serialis TaxID=139415 RepID=UPI0020084976|nr:uncharacterized protein B0H18DRAFT_1214371 [Neoantrodia serialis]KAH9918006.1 hypothetical protein B0H18DRAFT_1214371 [Neoantrodia serialis]